MAAAFHLRQSFEQIDFTARIMIGSQQRGADHDVVLRAVHMAEGKLHQLIQYLDGIFGCLGEAHTKDTVDAGSVALTADVMAIDAAGLASLYPVADGALHLHIFEQVFQRCFADQAFLFHMIPPSVRTILSKSIRFLKIKNRWM